MYHVNLYGRQIVHTELYINFTIFRNKRLLIQKCIQCCMVGIDEQDAFVLFRL